MLAEKRVPIAGAAVQIPSTISPASIARLAGAQLCYPYELPWSPVKRSVIGGGHKTSVSLEDAFWRGLKEIAASRRVPLRDLVARIDTDREHGNLSSAIRPFVLNHYKAGVASHLSDSRPSAIIAHASH